MTLVARIMSSKSGRIVEKRLEKGGVALSVPKGATVEVVDSETGVPVAVHSAKDLGQELILEFAGAEGLVELKLSGAVTGLAAALAAAADAGAASSATQAEEVGSQDGEAADTGVADAVESDARGGGLFGDTSPVLLGILGLGALGGIAAAASGGGSGKDDDRDTSAPSAPTSLDLAAADDTGAADDDGITNQGSGLTITGTAEAGARVELFDGAQSLGTATVDASGKFTLEISLGEGAHSITAKATDAAGNVSQASSALSITVDATAPTAAIAMSSTALGAGETATVTITFSEPVPGLSSEDIVAGSGALSNLASADGGLTWTATFTPAQDVTDLTNVITLGAGYADVAGNTGEVVFSENYSVETVTFTVSEGEDGAVNFGGSASGPISITLNASDEAVFSRGGREADTVIEGISSKVMVVPEGGQLNVALDGAASTDSFTLNAPNAAKIVFTGDGGALDDALSLIIESATAGADTRDLAIDTSGLEGVETIRFVFPEDADDIVKLTADSDLSGFGTIEVSKGGVDLTAVDIEPGVEFIVNSTLILTLEQFEAMASLVSVTGLGKLTINLTAEQLDSHALDAFLASQADKPLLIGTTVTIRDADGTVVAAPEGLDAISYPGIPELSDLVDALEDRIDGLGIDDVADLASTLAGLSGAIAALQSATGEGGELATRIDSLSVTLTDYVDDAIAEVNGRIDGLTIADVADLGETIGGLNEAIAALQASAGASDEALGERISALEGQLAGITGSVVAYVDGEVAGLQSQIDGLGIDDIAELATRLSALDTSIAALEALTGAGGETDERISALEAQLAGIADTVVAYVDGEIADVQSQIDELGIDDIAELATRLSSLDTAIASLQGASSGITTAIGQPANPGAEPPVEATGLYLHIEQAITAATSAIDAQIAELQAQIDDLDTDDIAGLASNLSSLGASITALETLTGEGGALDERITGLEEKLAGVTGTVISYVDAQIDALRDDSAGEDGASLDSIAGLKAAIEALLGGSNLGDPEVEGSLAFQLAQLQSQIDAIEIDDVAPTVLDVQLDSATGADAEGHLNAGDKVTATVKFSEAVLVTGNPVLLLTVGDGENARTVEATLTGGAGTDTLTFSYTIDGEDFDATGVSIGENALVLGEDDGITDKAGNAVAADFAAVADNPGFIVDNGPLELDVRPTAIFGGEDIASQLIFGLLFNPDAEGGEAFLTLADLDANGEYALPEGWFLLPMDEYLNVRFGAPDESVGFENAIIGGQTVTFDLSEYVILQDGMALAVSESALREALSGVYGQTWMEEEGITSIDEVFSNHTISFDALGPLVGATISADFLALIEGHDPADVYLDVTAPLTVAQAAALAEAGFDMRENVDYTIRDYYTTVQAALADPDQAAALQYAEEIVSRGDELSNVVSMTAFDFFQNLRTELGAGDDVYNAGRGDELIVGQEGADTINLTTRDDSTDGIIYQSVHDGRTANMVDMTYSTDEDDYREGSTISVTINGRTYSYTTGDDGETAAEALQNLADVVMSRQAAGRVVVGMTYTMTLAGELAPAETVYLDELKGGTYMVQSGQYFISATNYFNLLAGLGYAADVGVSNLIPFALSGGETFTLTGEDYLHIDSAYIDAGDAIALEGMTVLASASAYSNFLRNYDLLEAYDANAALEAVLEATRYDDVSGVKVDGDTGKLTFTGGQYDENLAISAGNDVHGEDGEAIVNPGQAAMASIDFSANDADYPQLTNLEKTTEFERELRVTIEGKTITAKVVPGDAEASVAALHAAIEAAMLEGATSAITAATSAIDLGELVTEDSPLEGYSLTLTINGRSVELGSEDLVSVSDLMAAIGAVGGVQSVTLEDGKLVVTGEVRGADASQNSVSMTGITIDGEAFEATDTVAVGGSLNNLIDDVSLDGTKLTFTGFVPESDDDAPTFEIDNGEIDKSGVQEELTVSFSTDDEDYYAGGTLKVTINGVDFEADMIAGSAFDSMEALLTKIQEAIGQDSTGALGLESAQFEVSPVGRPMTPEGIRLVASSEAPDAIDVAHVEQSYRGEEQTATITLEDSRAYEARVAEEDGGGRYADVYFEGGRVHATFVPRVDDGEGGLMDGEPVTVSAAMVVDAVSNFIAENFNPSDYIGSLSSNAFQLSITIDGQTYTESDFVDYLNELDPAISLVSPGDTDGTAKATYNDLAEWIGTLDGVAEVTLAGTGITILYDAGSEGTVDSVGGAQFPQEAGQVIGSVETQFGVGRHTITNDTRGNPEATAQALADAINAETGVEKVIHTLFDTDETLSIDSEYYTGIGRTFSVDVTIEGQEFDYIYGNSDMPDVATVGDLLAFLNERFEGYGVWSLNADGNGFDLTVAADADVVFADRPAIVISDAGAPLSLEPAAGDLVIDRPKLPFIGHAEVGEDGTITVTASEVGKDTFSIVEVTMDYEGVHQISTAFYDAEGNYYDGGTLSVEIDTTPGEEGGLVRIQANMVDGDREASLRNLVDEINSHTQQGDTAARIVFPVVLPDDEMLTENIENDGVALDDGLYVSSWSVTVGTGEDAVTYSGRGELVTVEGESEWHSLAGVSAFANLGDFLDFISNLEGVGSATLDEDGNIVVSSEAEGSGAYISGSFDISLDLGVPESPHLSASASDYGSSGALNGVVSHAELGANGELVIVSADATEHQFSITDAELSREPVRQEAEAEFSEDSSDYYDGGKIGLVVNGVTVETDMVVKPATSEVGISGLSPSDYLSGHIFHLGGGSTSWPTVNVDITIDGQSYDEEDLAQYLSQLSPPLVLPNELDDPATTCTFQNFADWIETLDGVAGVSFTADGLTIAYEAGVEGRIDQFTGAVFHGVDDPVQLSSYNGPEGLLDNSPAGGDPEATLQNLRDAIWEQVTVRAAVIDIDDSLTEDSVIGSWFVSEENDVFSNDSSEATLGSFLAALEMLSGVESATLVDGRIVIAGSHDLPPSGEPSFAFSISNANLGVPDPSQYAVGSDLYGAFASVEVTDDGGIWFTAANAVDGYGEINITDVHMSVPGQVQITEVDFDYIGAATGLVDENGDPGEISINVAGQTITAELQGTQSDTIRALAQAIVEARDGTFEEEAISAEAADRAAVVRIELPDGVDGDSRVINDGVDHAAVMAFSVRFAEDGPLFSYAPVSSTFDLSVDQLVAELNGQLGIWAGVENLDPEQIGSFRYDADTNAIVLTSNATGDDAYVEVETASISQFWKSSRITNDGEAVGLSYSDDEPHLAGGSSRVPTIRIDVSESTFLQENGGGYEEASLVGEDGGARFELHFTAFDEGGNAQHFDYYSGSGTYADWISSFDLNTVAADANPDFTLNDIIAYLNDQIAQEFNSAAFGAPGAFDNILSLDTTTGEIVMSAPPGFTLSLQGEDAGTGNDFRVETGAFTGEDYVVDGALVANDGDVLRVDVPAAFYTQGGPVQIDGVGHNYADLATFNPDAPGGPGWTGSVSMSLQLLFKNGEVETPYNFFMSSDGITNEDIDSATFNDGRITLADVVAYMNTALANNTDLAAALGVSSDVAAEIRIENGDIVIVPAPGLSVDLIPHPTNSFYDGLKIVANPAAIGLQATGGSYHVGTSIQEAMGSAVIDLPVGVTGGSLIHGTEGNFPFAEASTDIRVTFTVGGDVSVFQAPANLDHDMTVADFVAYLNDQLTQFESDNLLGDVGMFSFADGQITFAPASGNANLSSYQINEFAISGFVATDAIGGATAGAVDVENVLDTGESDALVMRSDDRAISEDDLISMDLVDVTLTIGGEEHSATFRPELVEKQGQSGSTVGDFLSWLNNRFDGVTAVIEDGDIVISGEGLSKADISLDLLDAWHTLSSEAVELTGPTGGASGGSITLAEFAGLSGDELLSGDIIDFDLFVGGVTFGGDTVGKIVSISYEIEEGNTLDDLLEYIEEHVATQTGGTQYLSATLGENGIEFSLSGASGIDHLWVSGLSLTVEQERTNAVSQVADVLGEVDFGEDSIVLHGNDVGPDELDVGSISYDAVDTQASVFQQAVVEFNNSKLDNVTNGSVISITLLGKTSSITVSTDGTPADGELDLSGTTMTQRSSLILDQLMAEMYADHGPSDAMGAITRGYRDGEGNFTADSSATSTVLLIDADRYGQSALGAMDDIKATIVDANIVEQFSVLAEQIRAGTVVFTGGTGGVNIHDETDEGGKAQTGRNESVIHYQESGGEDPDGAYILDDIKDDAPGVTLGWEDREEFNYLDIDDDEEEGVSPGTIDQSWTNPGGATGYSGEKGATGANGVQQSHQNPDDGYAAIDDSPATNENDGATGDDAHYGGASGSYDLDGLHTDHLDGQAPVDGEDYYGVDKVGSETAVTGGYHDELTDSDHGEDSFHHDDIQDGFAAFTWDDVLQSTKVHANAGPDVINNFQVDHDFLGFEGAIEESTVSGNVETLYGYGMTGGEHFNLDEDEFGIVVNGWSNLDSNQLMDADQVSELLGEMFSFGSNGEDEDINTSIFAIGADDDPNTIAIWAHTQSSGDDNTVDADELSLLAIVHTTGGSFGYDNLQMMNHGYEPV